MTSVLNAQPFNGWAYQKVGDMLQPNAWGGFAVADIAETRSVVLFGGGDQYGNFYNLVRRYSIATNSWDILPVALPYAWLNNERFGAARASNGKFYLSPGNGPGGGGLYERIIEVDLATNTAVERAPVIGPGSRIWGVALAPAPASRGGVYLFGGWNGWGLSEIRHYDPATDQMTVIGNLSIGRTVGARVIHPNGRVYLFGGNWYSMMNAMDVFDTATETVHAIPNPQGFTFDHSTQGWVGPDDAIYLWNPIAPQHGVNSGSLIRFDPVTETFANTGPTPGAGAMPGSLIRDSTSQDVYTFGLTLPGYVWGVSGTTVGEVWKFAPNCTFAPAPWTASRTTAAPAWSTLTFDSCGGAGVLTVTNAGSASAVVMLNGVQVAAPQNFNANVTTLSIPVTLASGQNTLQVQLRSKPGSQLMFTFSR